MQRPLTFCLCLYLSSQTCLAKEIKKSAITSFRIEALSLRMEQSDKTRLARQAYAFNIHQALKQLKIGQLHCDLNLTHAPDSLKKSQAIDVRRHFHAAHARLGLSYIYGFRFRIAAGLSLWRSQTSLKIPESEINRIHFSAGSSVLAGIDYAVFEHFEISANSVAYMRHPQQMFDWSYGLGLQFSY